MKKLLIILLSIIALSLYSCKKDNPVVPTPTSQSDQLKIPTYTKSVDSTVFRNQLVSISPDSTTFTFKAGSSLIDNLKANDIIVSSNGLGILKKITSVSRSNNQIIVHASSAKITDAIENGEFTITRSVSSSNVNKMLYMEKGVSLAKTNAEVQGFYLDLNNVVVWDNDGNLSTSSDQITLNGSISISPTIDMSLKIQNWKLKYLKFSTSISEDLDLKANMNIIGVALNKKKEIYRAYLNPLVAFIGPVPVVITPVLTINVGADAKVYVDVSTGIKQHADFTGGLLYSDGQMSPISNQSHSFTFDPPHITAGANFKAYVGPQWSYLLYGVVGPYTEVSLYGELNADLTQNPWATLYAGIEINGGVKFEILSHNIIDYYAPAILGYKLKLWESSTLPKGTIKGNVRDAVTNNPLGNVVVSVLDNNNVIATTTTRSDGGYSLDVSAKTGYKVVFSKQGYLNTEYLNVDVVYGNSTILETILQINQAYSGSGDIGGIVKNALNGLGVGGANVLLRKGLNVSSGGIVSSTTSNNNGEYLFTNISAGNYTLEITKSNYNTSYYSAICVGGRSLLDQDVTISPILNVGETRIVLTWGLEPQDLDSHLTGPLPNGSRFHMYYHYANINEGSPWPQIVTLDLDDVNSYGPETTTLYQQISGVYRFSVHDYSNKELNNSYALSNSGAVVRVYQSSGLIKTFNVPPNSGGTLWTVFEMNGSTITPINQMSYVNDETQINKVGYINPDIKLLKVMPKK